MEKKAISPLITTVLLVLITIVLAAIIFIWAVSFRGEQIIKFIGGEQKDIQVSCDSVLFSAELSSDQQSISIVNTGDVPIYRFDIRTEGDVNSLVTSITTEMGRVNPGQATSLVLPAVSSGDKLNVIPILLGTDKDGAEKEASCINSGIWAIIEV